MELSQSHYLLKYGTTQVRSSINNLVICNPCQDKEKHYKSSRPKELIYVQRVYPCFTVAYLDSKQYSFSGNNCDRNRYCQLFIHGLFIEIALLDSKLYFKFPDEWKLNWKVLITVRTSSVNSLLIIVYSSRY